MATLISLLPWLALATLIAVVAAVAAELAARGWLRRRGRYYALKPFTTTVMQVDKQTLPDLEDEVRIMLRHGGPRLGSVSGIVPYRQQASDQLALLGILSWFVRLGRAHHASV